MSEMPLVHPQDSGIEPDAPDQSQCTHCSQPIGSPHLPDCLALSKSVLVRYCFELEVTVPFSWTPEQIEDHANEGCSEFALEAINAEADDHGLCEGAFTCEFVADLDTEPRVTINEPNRELN